MECVCEMAEYLYIREKANKLGTIKSFSNDGKSATYTDQSKSASEEHIEKREIVVRHFRNTKHHNDFVFVGV
jgi:hypothetical protein